jgi:predicted O-methyltransferase YrrM
MNFKDVENLPLYWEMVNAEKIALLNLLSETRPEISIEIGTKKGGSLQLISALSSEVYSLDIDSEVLELQPVFPDVKFIVGDSKETLPALLNKLSEAGRQPDFILIDGDHSLEGVKSDLQSILNHLVVKPLTVIMHDSFNPECRQGMLTADYSKNENVTSVEIDFVQGIYSPTEFTKGEMWGGFGKIVFNPGARQQEPLIKQSSRYSFEKVYSLSKHFWFSQKSFQGRVKSFLFRRFYS